MRKKQTQKAKTTAAGPVYSFPTRSRCPRCGAVDTVSTTTQGEIQSRECRRPICRHKYKVLGEKI